MGKTISAPGQYPFAIGGLKAGKAVINGQTATKAMYIHKQRSDIMYDLIDEDGNIFYFIELVWYDVNGVNLANTVLPANANIKNNSFVILIDDGVNKGYAMLFQYHKIKLNNNLYSYRDAHQVFVAVTGVTVTPDTLTGVIGGTAQLTATVAPANASERSVTWSTSNAAICTVSSTGLVTYVAAGTATVTATTVEGHKTDTCAVTVTA